MAVASSAHAATYAHADENNDDVKVDDAIPKGPVEAKFERD
jgi:hypothetical protein